MVYSFQILVHLLFFILPTQNGTVQDGIAKHIYEPRFVQQANQTPSNETEINESSVKRGNGVRPSEGSNPRSFSPIDEEVQSRERVEHFKSLEALQGAFLESYICKRWISFLSFKEKFCIDQSYIYLLNEQFRI